MPELEKYQVFYSTNNKSQLLEKLSDNTGNWKGKLTFLIF